MPKPPKETMGGFVDTMMSLEKTRIESEILVVKELTLTKEFETYDEDFKLAVKNRLKTMEKYNTELGLTLSN